MAAPVAALSWPPPPDWPQQLRTAGALRISGVPLHPDNDALRAMAAELGPVSTRGLSHRAGLVESGAVQRVEALPGPVLDQYAKSLRSASSEAFALHSDESFCVQPARWVLLHCCQPAETGGDTLLLAVEEILAQVPREVRIALEQLRLPYPCGDRVTIEPSGMLRFNAEEVESAALRRGVPLSLPQRGWLARFEQLFARQARRLRLDAGDLLIIDNWRVLHGRTAFAASSGRLLKRLRVL
ncbi:MAG: TauD/TfdA family dioxygenase [Lysobacterales bacterium]